MLPKYGRQYRFGFCIFSCRLYTVALHYEFLTIFDQVKPSTGHSSKPSSLEEEVL